MPKNSKTDLISEAQEHLGKGKISSAKTALKKFMKSGEENPDAFFLLGHALMREEKFADALENFRKAVALNSSSPVYLNALGVLLFMMHAYDEAEETLRSALAISPSNMEVMGNLGILFRHTGYHDEALECLRTVRLNGSPSLKILEELGEELMRHNELLRALKLFEMIHKQVPSNVNALNKMALIHSVAGRWEIAEKFWRDALSLDPRSAEVYSHRGTALMNKGEMGKAIESIEKALSIDPDLAGANVIWAHMASDNEQSRMSVETVYKNIKGALDKEGVSFDDWENLSFAAGKLAGQLKDYDAAFEFYDKANKAHWQRYPMPESFFNDRTQSLIETFDSKFFTDKLEVINRSPKGNDRAGEGLVFVFGMPRSGTTLGEHILARSSSVYPGGEREDIEEAFDRLTGFFDAPLQLSSNISSLDMRSVREASSQLHELFASRAKEKTYYVDKTPRHYMMLGFLAVVFPRAKFVHVVRNPVDTCLSCYFNYFTLHSQKFTYDLKMLGVVYRLYQEIMTHWEKVLPVPIHKLVYEDVVSSPEDQIKAYTEFCGLDWDERFLETESNRHTVKTASVVQVRKPIYTGSIDRWRRYEKHLKPLLQELGLN